MFSYLLKNLPAKYVFAGYSVRKGLSLMTTQVGNRVVYDIFEDVYIDNYLSFYIQMEDGNYKNVDLNVMVPEAKAEDIMSRHLYRGPSKDTSDYGDYNKEKVVAVFGVRDIETLIHQTDDIVKKEDGAQAMSLEAAFDIKNAYMGMEIMSIINKFNKYIKFEKRSLPIPAIRYSADDEFESVLGDEMDFFDFMSNKDSDQIVKDIQALVINTDGIGNAKKNVEIKVIKGDEGTAGSVEIVKN